MNWSGSRLIQDNVLWKPPKGKTLAFHQDAAYDDWIIPQTMATCWISLDDTSKFYKASDIFILPSLYEPFGNVCLEALSSGLLCIFSSKFFK